MATLKETLYDKEIMKSIFSWEIPCEEMIQRTMKKFGVDYKTAKSWCINYAMTA